MTNNNIAIINYKPEHQPYFEKFNREWIEENFELEALDKYVLQNPEEAIIATGGAILMAVCDGEIAGTAALRKINDGVYEFTKMTVDKNHRRKGIARLLCYAAFEKAKELKAEKVILYSNTLQAAAISLYRKIGFKEIPVEAGIYKRANIKMEFILSNKLIAV